VIRPAIASLAIVGLLAACSSTDDKPQSATDLASTLGCHFKDTSAELFVSQGGPCGSLTIETFSSDDAQSSWLKVAQDFGGPFLVGDQWVITGGNLKAAQAKVGGEIQ
jgi:hypothetical protein